MRVKLNKVNELSIIIPIYNEGNNILLLSQKIQNNISIKKYEIIFVDDNSDDDTFKNFLHLKKKNKNTRLILRKNIKRDLSKSCILGFKKARYKFIMVMDGDLQHDPKYIRKFISFYNKKNSDLIIGCRSIFGKSNNGLNFIRSLMSKFLIVFLNTMLGKKTKDPMSGFFLFDKKIFLKSKKKLFGNGYKILADLIYSSENNLKINDINISFKKRIYGESKMNFTILLLLLKFIFARLLR